MEHECVGMQPPHVACWSLCAPYAQVTIRELPGGVTLAGAVEREVHSREEMASLLEQGSLCRAVGATNMNNRRVDR